MKINIYPLHSHLLVKDLRDPTVAGIFPEGNQDADMKLLSGEVIRVGNGAITRNGVVPLSVRPGDTVVFIEELGIRIQQGEDYYYLLPEEATAAILDRDPGIGEIGDYQGMDQETINKILGTTEETVSLPDLLDVVDKDKSETQD